MGSFIDDYMLWWPQNLKTAQRGLWYSQPLQRGHSGYTVRRSYTQGHDRMCYAVLVREASSTRAHMKPEARSNDLSQIVALPYDLTVGQRGSPWDQR